MQRPSPTGRRGVTFAVLAVAAASFSMLQSLIVPVLAEVQVAFDTDQATVTWVLTAYLISASVFTPLLGRLGDIVGKKRVLVAALAFLAVGSVAAAVAPTIGWLIAARVLQGVGGGVMPLSFGIIRDEFAERTSNAIAVIASLLAVGFGVGIVAAGPIVDVFGFSGLFWLPALATGVAATAALLFVPESPVRAPGGLPLVPAVLLAGWLVALLLGVSRGNVWGWTSARVLGLLVGAVVLAVVWVVVERRAAVPMIDMAMMQQRGVWTANAIALCLGFGMFGGFAFLPQLLQTPTEVGYGFGASITESGHLLLPSAVASFLVGFATARLVTAVGPRAVITTGLVLTAGAFISIGLFHDATWQLYVATTVQGLGSGLVFSSLAGAVVAAVPAEQTGVATGMNNNIRTLGGSVGSAVMAGILATHPGVGGFPGEAGYTIGFVLLGSVVGVSVLAALFLPSSGPQPSQGRLVDAADAETGLVPGSVPAPAQAPGRAA